MKSKRSGLAVCMAAGLLGLTGRGADPGTTRDVGMDFSKPLDFKVHFIERTAKPPVIDAKLDEWSGVAALTDFAYATQIPPCPLRIARTEMRYLWDEKYLYIAAKCYEDAPENMASYRRSIAQKALAVYARDVVELHIDGKNDEWTKHTMWISGSGEKEGIWDYDFGWGLLTDGSWGVSADWTEAVGEGRDAGGDFWCAEVRVALADLEIVPRVGYIFGMEPTRFRFGKQWFKPDGSPANDLPGGVNGGNARLAIYGWGTQGVWHQTKTRFGKCVLVEKRPDDLIAGLRLAYPDLDRRTVRIRSTDGFLSVRSGKIRRESYLEKCRSLVGESRAELARLEPLLAVDGKPAEAVVRDVRKLYDKTSGAIAAAEKDLAARTSADAARLDQTEKASEAWRAAIDAGYYKAVCDLLVRERKVRFPVKLDPGKAAPDFSLKWGPEMTAWPDATCVKWAIPSAAGRKKVLACVYYGDTFAVRHLMNRIDVDCDILEVQYNRFRNTPQTMKQCDKLEAALARNRYDGFVFIGCGPAAWPDRLRCRLAELQLSGTPVAMVNGADWGSDFKADKDFLLGAPAYFDKLVSDHPELRTGRPESVATGPSPYALHWEKGVLKVPRVGSFGAGRVYACDAEQPECSTYIVHPVFSPSYATIPDRTFQDEYCLAYSCRVILEGLGMRGPVCAKELTLDAVALRRPIAGTLTVTGAAAWKGLARVTLRDNWGKVVQERVVPVDVPAGEHRVAFSFDGCESGEYWVDAILEADGRRCDFAAQRLTVRADFDEPQIAAIAPAKECFEKDEDIRATVRVANAVPGVTVEAAVRDPRYRILARGVFPVDPKTGLAELRFPADRFRLNCHFILATVKDAGGVATDRNLCWFFRRIGDLEDYRVFDSTSNHGGKDIEPRLAFLDWHGMDMLQLGSRTRLFYGTDPVVRNRIPGKFSNWHGAINSPAWKKWLYDAYTKQAKDLAARNGRFVSLGDDSGAPAAFVKGKCEWVQLFFRRLKPRLAAAAKAIPGSSAANASTAVHAAWLADHGITGVKAGWDFYWGLQKYLENGDGLKKLLAARFTEDEIAEIRASCAEAYGTIEIFNLANGMRLRSFSEITAATIPQMNPTESVEYPWFLAWLETRYGGDIAKLNAAWGANEKFFATIPEKTIDELKQLGKWTAEIDKQTFLEDSFLENCRIIGEAVKTVDPTIRVGFGASSLGNCLLDAFKYLDTAVPYFTREDGDLIRSRRHGYIGETMGWYGTSYGSDEESVPQSVRESQVWHPLLSGANFAWMWMTGIGFTGARTMSMNGFGYSFEAHREVQRGPAALVLRAEAQTDGVRILFSRDGGHMAAVKREPTSHPVARRAWERTVNELQLQYVHVTDDDILEGALDAAKVLILPMIDVARPNLAAKISAFLKRGGFVIADFMPGLYGPDGKKLAHGTLDTLMKRHPDRFVVLNRDLGLYAASIGKAESHATRNELAALFARAGVRPEIRVTDASGAPIDGVEISRFVRGGVTCFSVEKRSFAGEKFPMRAFVELPQEGWVCDVRKGRSFGRARRFEIALAGQDTAFYSFQPYEVKGLGLSLNRPQLGGTLRVTTKMPGVPAGDVRVLRVEFVPPEGFPKTAFAPIRRYIEDAPGGRLDLRVPMAFNERRDLTVEVTDVASGVSESLPLVFGEPPAYDSKKPGDVLLEQASLCAPVGGRADTRTVDAGKPKDQTAYYLYSFKAKLSGGRFNYWWIDSFDQDGNLLADINSKLYPSEDWRPYDELFQAEARAVRLLPAFCASTKSRWSPTAARLEVKDIVLRRVSDEEAAAWCDRLYRTLPQIDWTAPQNALWDLPKTRERLLRHKPLRIVMLGGSLCNDTYNGHVAAQLKRLFPLSEIEVIASVRGGTGVWYYGQDPHFKDYVLDYHPDLILVAGICHRGPNVRDADILDRERYFRRFIDRCREAGLEFALCTPPMSKDCRSTTDVCDFDPKRTDPAIIDRSLMDTDYLYALGHVYHVPVWNCTYAPYQALCRSGVPLESWMRDIVHCDDRAKQLNARAVVAHFLTAIPYAYPEADTLTRLWDDWGMVDADGRVHPFAGRTPRDGGQVITQTWRLIEDPERKPENDYRLEYAAEKEVRYTARFFDGRGTELESSRLTLSPATRPRRMTGTLPVPPDAVFVRHSFETPGALEIKSFGIGKHRLKEG